MADIKGKKVIGTAGSTLTIITYQGIKYLKTTNISGTTSTYKYLETGSDLSGVSSDGEDIKHAQEFLVSEEHYIKDNLGNKFQLVFVPYYEILASDENNKPTLVGRAPGGTFGGKP